MELSVFFHFIVQFLYIFLLLDAEVEYIKGWLLWYSWRKESRVVKMLMSEIDSYSIKAELHGNGMWASKISNPLEAESLEIHKCIPNEWILNEEHCLHTWNLEHSTSISSFLSSCNCVKSSNHFCVYSSIYNWE